MSAGPGLSLPLFFLPLSSIHDYSHVFSVGLPCALSVGWRQSQNHLLQPQPAGYTSCFVLRFGKIFVKLPFFTLAEWFLPSLQHSLLPEGFYLSSNFQVRGKIERAKPTRLPCTTTSSPTEQGKEHTAAPTDPTASADKNGSQSYRHQNAIFTSVLVPEFQILQEY